MKFFCRASLTLALGQVSAFVVPPASQQISRLSRHQGKLRTCVGLTHVHTEPAGVCGVVGALLLSTASTSSVPSQSRCSMRKRFGA